MTTFTAMMKAFLVRISVPLEEGQSHPFIGLLVILFGLFNVLKPEAAWHISRGWQFKDAGPSDEAIWFTRVSGGIVIVIGLFLMF